jgi:hypothetical protein
MADFIEEYLSYLQETESPYNYHRWCGISVVGALLGRNFYLEHGHSRIFPNIYCMLLGEPAARKSTAIKIAKRLVSASGYDNLGADKTTKEKFLLDLEGLHEDPEEIAKSGASPQQIYDAVTERNLFGPDSFISEPREVFIMADEWNEFTTPGNGEFYTTLGNLWDWDDEQRPFTQRVKNTKSVSIFQPTVSILGGNTPEKFAEAFPPAIIGGGFLSRMILVHGERSERKYPFPPKPDPAATELIVQRMRDIRAKQRGVAALDADAVKVLSEIYLEGGFDIDDVRFRAYNNRRFTQLIKLCLIHAAARDTNIIGREIVIAANTALAAAERYMPKAIGEFGKAKNSDVANKIMELLDSALKPMSAKDIWRHVHSDLEKLTQLGEVMQSLQTADKVMHVKDQGWLSKPGIRMKPKYVDWSLLTSEEQAVL